MKELHDIATSLLNVDGGCRDVNFERPTWEGVQALLGDFTEVFTDGSVRDREGKLILGPLTKAIQVLATDGGRAHLEGGDAPMSRLQVFVYREEDGSPFVELTFFPQDIADIADVRGNFTKWAESARRVLQAQRCYCRYEDASWTFGDVGQRSGVFLVFDGEMGDA